MAAANAANGTGAGLAGQETKPCISEKLKASLSPILATAVTAKGGEQRLATGAAAPDARDGEPLLIPATPAAPLCLH